MQVCVCLMNMLTCVHFSHFQAAGDFCPVMLLSEVIDASPSGVGNQGGGRG